MKGVRWAWDWAWALRRWINMGRRREEACGRG